MILPKLKIAIAGIGTVGKGLLRILEDPKNKTLFEISAIASRKKLNFSEKKKFKDILLFSDAEKLINFDGYDILIELIGGDEGIAKKIVFDALNKKKKVVTANKALISKHWETLNEISKKNNTVIKFEAAVAGGIPIIKIIDEFLDSNSIKRVYGILNGTSNYILTKMLTTNKVFLKF